MNVLSVLKCFSVLLLFWVIASCNSSRSSSKPSPVVLTPVSDYVLEDTTTYLASIRESLTGLPLTEFYDQSFRFIESRNLEGVLADGRIEEFPSLPLELNNISDDYDEQTVALYGLIRELLLTYDSTSLNFDDLLSYDIYLTFLNFEIERGDFRQFQFPAAFGFFGWPGSTELFFTQVLTIETKADAERYLALLNQVGRRFQQIEQLLEARRQDGVIEPRTTLSSSRDAVRAMANSSASSTSYYQALNNRLNQLPDASAEERNQLRNTLIATIEQRVIPAYQSLESRMNALVNEAPNSIGVGQFAGGDQYYQFALRFFTGTELTADDIHQLGEQEIARIHSELSVLFNQLGYPPSESIAQRLNRARSDGGVVRGANAVDFFEQIIAEAYSVLPQSFSTIPQQEVIVVGGSSGGYYISGSEDGSRPGAFYAQTNVDLAYYTMPTLAYHEAVPGHHMQIALTQEMELQRFRKEIRFTSFIEGWGLYAERLAKDLGWYQDDIYGDIGRLEFEAMRASRLVIDTGIHSKGWSFNQAQQYSQFAVGHSGSIARYSVWPGQATAYMTGLLEILAQRERAQTQLGAQYDIKSFHDAVLNYGFIPSNYLERVVSRYIEQAR